MKNQLLTTSIPYSQSTTMLPRIAVIGCTGTVGSEVMRQLAQQSCYVTGFLRNPERLYPVPLQERPARVSYITVNHQSLEQLTRACQDTDALFLLMGNHPQQIQSERRVIEAAQHAGVRRIVKLSAPLIPNSPINMEVASWHREIEQLLQQTVIEHCSLRPFAFMQNWLSHAVTIKRFGLIYGSAGNAPRNYTDARDIAAIATRLLLNKEPLPSTTLSITGPEAICNQEMAERISQVIGSTVRYKNLSKAEHFAMLVQRANMPEWLARHVVELEELAVQIPERQTNVVMRLLGQPARKMDAFLQENRNSFKRPYRPILSGVSKYVGKFLMG